MTEEKQRKGTRCAVCTMCGRCFDEASGESGPDSSSGWTGMRCEVCVSCGKCAEAWGLVGSDADTESGPTSWADAFKVMDVGQNESPPPPVRGAPGVAASEFDAASEVESPNPVDGFKRPIYSSFATLKRIDDGSEPDTSTGATPGVSAACEEHGFGDMDDVIAKLGIKPPGVA